VAAIASGQIVARTGLYKPIILAAMLVMAAGLFMMTHLTPDTELWVLALWMFVTGLGIGPVFAVFTLVVQNNVPLHELGAGTSSVTLFQQVGGSVGLAITGTLFGSVLLEQVPKQLADAGVPPEFSGAFAGSDALNNLAGVGDLGAAILAQVPPEFQAQVEPLIPGIVHAIHVAFSMATAATFAVGIFTALAAALVILFVMPGGRMGHTAPASAEFPSPDAPEAPGAPEAPEASPEGAATT